NGGQNESDTNTNQDFNTGQMIVDDEPIAPIMNDLGSQIDLTQIVDHSDELEMVDGNYLENLETIRIYDLHIYSPPDLFSARQIHILNCYDIANSVIKRKKNQLYYVSIINVQYQNELFSCAHVLPVISAILHSGTQWRSIKSAADFKELVMLSFASSLSNTSYPLELNNWYDREELRSRSSYGPISLFLTTDCKLILVALSMNSKGKRAYHCFVCNKKVVCTHVQSLPALSSLAYTAVPPPVDYIHVPVYDYNVYSKERYPYDLFLDASLSALIQRRVQCGNNWWIDERISKSDYVFRPEKHSCCGAPCELHGFTDAKGRLFNLTV
ncbi:hypothetical protein HDV02_004779, partial [Globomyces sp. JEL0801]